MSQRTLFAVIALLVVVLTLPLWASAKKGLPKDCPQYPGSEMLSQGCPGWLDGVELSFVALKTSDTPDEVKKYYDSVLAEGGWSPVGNKDFYRCFQKGKRFLYFSIVSPMDLPSAQDPASAGMVGIPTPPAGPTVFAIAEKKTADGQQPRGNGPVLSIEVPLSQ